jgi:hypothetical protein
MLLTVVAVKRIEHANPHHGRVDKGPRANHDGVERRFDERYTPVVAPTRRPTTMGSVPLIRGVIDGNAVYARDTDPFICRNYRERPLIEQRVLMVVGGVSRFV